MGFLTNYAQNSFRMSNDELDIIQYVFSLVEDGLPFPRPPSHLIDDISICWAPEMVFSDDSTFGMWTYMHRDSVFIRPEENRDMAFRMEINAKKLDQRDMQHIDAMKHKPCYSEIVCKHIPNANHSLLSFVFYLLENDGTMAVTILHELWHREQFISHPMLYLLSCMATNLVNYEWACKQSWSIEHDVRVKVDNDITKSKVKAVYVPFYEYIRLLDKYHAGISDMGEMDAVCKRLAELEEIEFVREISKMVGIIKD